MLVLMDPFPVRHLCSAPERLVGEQQEEGEQEDARKEGRRPVLLCLAQRLGVPHCERVVRFTRLGAPVAGGAGLGVLLGGGAALGPVFAALGSKRTSAQL